MKKTDESNPLERYLPLYQLISLCKVGFLPFFDIMGATGISMPTKILVIDDDAAVTDLLALLLKSQGFEVSVTNNSGDGLNMIRETPPDLVVLDLMMPEVDGWEVCRAVRSFSKVPIIVLSALNDPSMIASVLDAGADDYLTKPTPSRVLVAHINRLVKRNGSHGHSTLGHSPQMATS